MELKQHKKEGRFMSKERKDFKKWGKNNRGMGTVEMILIIVEKPNAKHRYVLCGN